MVRVHPTTKEIANIGPRSAHIAGLRYECFAEDSLKDCEIRLISPRESDPCEYATVLCKNNASYSLTLAGAANLLGYVPTEDYAHGIDIPNRDAWDAFGKYLGISGDDAARKVVDLATTTLQAVIEDLVAEYELDRNFVTLVGGGGSGAVIVFALAEKMGFQAKLAKNAPYISTIGVALAMVREQIERTVLNPSEDDIKRIRQDVLEKTVRSGANETTVDITIEVDMQKNVLRAIATGATELRQKDLSSRTLSAEELEEITSQALDVPVEQLSLLHQVGRWNIFAGVRTKKVLLGLIKTKQSSLCVIDREGTVRLRKAKANCAKFSKAQINTAFHQFMDDNTTYSDANASIPCVFIFYREKMLDLSSLQTADQVYSLLQLETELLDSQEELLAVAYR